MAPTEFPEQGKFCSKEAWPALNIRRFSKISKTCLDTFTYYQEEVSEINQNQECGLRVEDKDVQFQAGDIVTCFSTRWVFN